MEEGEKGGSGGRGSGRGSVLIDRSKGTGLVICPNRSHKAHLFSSPRTPSHQGMSSASTNLMLKKEKKSQKRSKVLFSLFLFLCCCFFPLQILSAQQKSPVSISSVPPRKSSSHKTGIQL